MNTVTAARNHQRVLALQIRARAPRGLSFEQALQMAGDEVADFRWKRKKRWVLATNPPTGIAMYLLHLDHAGAVEDPSQKHFVLAGIAVFERQTYWLSQELEKIAATPADPPAIELQARQCMAVAVSGENFR